MFPVASRYCGIAFFAELVGKEIGFFTPSQPVQLYQGDYFAESPASLNQFQYKLCLKTWTKKQPKYEAI